MEAKTLALYLGCQFVYKWSPPKNGWNQSAPMTLTLEALLAYQNDGTICPTLLLRPLSSMTEEEGKEYAGLFFEDYNPELTKFYNFGHCISIRYYDAFLHLPDEYTPKQFTWLLSKGFDLFGLIEKGDAIDSTKL